MTALEIFKGQNQTQHLQKHRLTLESSVLLKIALTILETTIFKSTVKHHLRCLDLCDPFIYSEEVFVEEIYNFIELHNIKVQIKEPIKESRKESKKAGRRFNFNGFFKRLTSKNRSK